LLDFIATLSFQVVPFHFWISAAPLGAPTVPTAHALLPDVATLDSALLVPGLGLATCDQLPLLFGCIMSVLGVLLLVVVKPTAQAPLAEVEITLLSPPPFGRVELGCCDHPNGPSARTKGCGGFPLE
jgi:hypothetical protein